MNTAMRESAAMGRSAAQLPESLGEVFRVSEAMRAGASAQRLRATDLDSPFRGVRRVREAEIARGEVDPFEFIRLEHIGRARAYLEVAPTGAFFCGPTAAAIMRLPVPLRGGQPIEVGVAAPQRAPRVRGVSSRQVLRKLVELGTARGLPVSSPATTWAMLGRELTRDELVVLGDAIVHLPRIPGTQRLDRQPHASPEDLHGAIAAGQRAGAVKLREALKLIRTGSASPPETLLRLALIDAGYPEPELDVDVYDGAGRLLGASELAYRELKIAYEYESRYHRTSSIRWNRDLVKYARYEEAGWKVIRVTGEGFARHRQEILRQTKVAFAVRGA